MRRLSKIFFSQGGFAGSARCNSRTFLSTPTSSISFLKKGLEKMKQSATAASETQSLSNVQEHPELAQQQQQEQQQPKHQFSPNRFGKDPLVDEQPSESADQYAQIMRQQQQEDELEFEQMSNQHRALQAKATDECDIPFKLYGMLKMPKTKAAYMPERVFAQQRISKSMVIDHLKKIYFGTLHSMVEIDEEFLNEYLEPNFAQKLIESLKQHKEKGYKLEIYQDDIGIRGEPITEECYLGDMVMIRGLSVDRSKNLSQKDYHMWKDIDDMGLVVYTPQYLTEPLEFIDPERNKTIYDDYKKVVLRAMLYLKNPHRIRVVRPDGTAIQIDDNLYTWEHLALFETQMRVPPQFKSDYKLENYMEWLGKFNFGVWKMADLDNWNHGNPLITSGNDREKYKDEIFKNSKYDPEINIDIKNV